MLQSNNDSILSVQAITKNFGGVVALNGASFEILSKSISALIGPNGAGKTTLFNIITGFFQPDQGKIFLENIDITGLPTHKLFHQGLIRTFQIPASFERMTVLDNLMSVPKDQTGENLVYTLLNLGKIKNEEKKIYNRAIEVLNFLEIETLANLFAGELSGGQKKLLELGKVMMTNPKIVLLDEPAAGVNPTLMKKLAKFIKRLNQEKGYTFCIIEHDMDFISSLCDPVIVMTEGSVLTQGKIESIRSNKLVKDAYLGNK